MADDCTALVERLFDAFNRRDAAGIVEVCDERLEFFSVTAETVGRSTPYVGPGGLSDYLSDVARVWEELLITPLRVEQREGLVLVRGRVYARSRELGIRDMPVAWVWAVRGGLFVRGEVFTDPQAATSRFAALAA